MKLINKITLLVVMIFIFQGCNFTCNKANSKELYLYNYAIEKNNISICQSFEDDISNECGHVNTGKERFRLKFKCIETIAIKTNNSMYCENLPSNSLDNREEDPGHDYVVKKCKEKIGVKN